MSVVNVYAGSLINGAMSLNTISGYGKAERSRNLSFEGIYDRNCNASLMGIATFLKKEIEGSASLIIYLNPVSSGKMARLSRKKVPNQPLNIMHRKIKLADPMISWCLRKLHSKNEPLEHKIVVSFGIAEFSC